MTQTGSQFTIRLVGVVDLNRRPDRHFWSRPIARNTPMEDCRECPNRISSCARVSLQVRGVAPAGRLGLGSQGIVGRPEPPGVGHARRHRARGVAPAGRLGLGSQGIVGRPEPPGVGHARRHRARGVAPAGRLGLGSQGIVGRPEPPGVGLDGIELAVVAPAARRTGVPRDCWTA